MASNRTLLGSTKAFEALSRPAAGVQLRCLSASASRQAHLEPIRFHPTGNPELLNQLEFIREKIVIPSYLQEWQKKKVYSPKYKQELSIDPVILEVDGKEYKFGYINIHTDLPETRKNVTKAINMMKNKWDMDNLRPLLEGVKQAKRKLPWVVYPKLARLAGQYDNIPVILECAWHVEKTGFRLTHSETVNELLCWIQKKALDSDWDEKETKKALKRAIKLIETIEAKEEHHPKGNSPLEVPVDEVTARQIPLYRDPQVLSARLHLAAALAVKRYDGKDVNNVVTKYAQELLALWPEGAGLTTLHPEAAYLREADMGYLIHTPKRFLWHASPILHGLQLAAKIVEPELAKQLLQRAAVLKEEMKTAISKDETLPEGTVYTEYFGQKKVAS
ncbi:hypothetical protein B0H66DRAFT_205195 [Apodospora peruviana]|uniref:Uncharacterized protein n=1 Tax=Apodospora peruviana TaxID=516989 RepID=A0AAE0ICJ8_9PEZI|nr:hypothetical protein B0H66DRAFT_205195 [Apodospora peruviana]